MTAAPLPVTAPDARRRAEALLLAYDSRVFTSAGESVMAEALRALLASPPAPDALPEEVAEAAERLRLAAMEADLDVVEVETPGIWRVSTAIRDLLSALGAKR